MKTLTQLDDETLSSTSRPVRTNPPSRILVAEDDPIIRRCCSEVLTRAGYTVDAAADGAAAWDFLHASRYDLLVTDYIMPRMSGIELCGKLRAAGMVLPVILVSGALPKEELERYPWLKFAALLGKPFTPDQLLATVSETLSAPGEVHNHKGASFPFSIACERPPLPPSRWGINE